MNHRPWIGRKYEAGIEGQRVAIFGFSHWGDRERPNFSAHVIARWALRGRGGSFFDRIQAYFAAADAGDFWQRVLFANTLPSMVGNGDQRYGDGTPEQRASVPDRVHHILTRYKPDKTFVFTRKGWHVWPLFDGVQEDRFLTVDGADRIPFGIYQTGPSAMTVAYGFRHPQYSPTEPMRQAVATALRHRL